MTWKIGFGPEDVSDEDDKREKSPGARGGESTRKKE